MDVKLSKKMFWLLPVFLAFILSSIITLSNNWPLSWDIYVHMNYALAYLSNGITTVDPFLNAPMGKHIGYAPLFHILLILVSSITGTDFITSARLFQIILPVIMTLTVSYVSYKMYNEFAGVASGLLLISSFMFTRLLLPIPETIAIIFFTLGVYLFYQATITDNKIFAFASGLMGLLMLSVHFSSFVYYVILLIMLMFVQLITQRNYNSIKSFIFTCIPMLFVIFIGLCVLFVLNSSYSTQIIQGIYSIISNPFSLFMGQKAMGFERYVKCIGVIPLIFAIIGLFYSFKDKEVLFLSLWALISFVFSNLHWFGIPVYTYRLLLYVIVPATILGGYAFSKIIGLLNYHKKSIGFILILALIIVSFCSGYGNINDNSAKITSADTEISSFQIAPPTSDEVNLINWFNNEDTGNKSILINNLFLGTVISSVDEVPLHYNFDVYTNSSLSKSSIDSLNDENIGYIVYDKELVLNNSSDYDTLEVVYVNGSYYPSYYFTKEITDDNFEGIQLIGTRKVYENNRFIVCEVL